MAAVPRLAAAVSDAGALGMVSQERAIVIAHCASGEAIVR